jgi:hypothetical protein
MSKVACSLWLAWPLSHKRSTWISWRGWSGLDLVMILTKRSTVSPTPVQHSLWFPQLSHHILATLTWDSSANHYSHKLQCLLSVVFPLGSKQPLPHSLSPLNNMNSIMG